MSDQGNVPQPRRQAIRLNAWARWLFAVLGAVSLGGGALAVFTRDVESGPVAMLGIGAFFLTIGIVGVMPTRLKVGENEAEFLEEVGEELAAVSELVPPESRPELILALERLSRVAPEAASPAMAGLAYEELVSVLLGTALRAINDANNSAETFELDAEAGHWSSEFDAVIRQGNRLAVGVDIKPYTKPLGRMMIHKLAGLAAAWQPGTEAKRVLLVTRSPLRSAAQDEVAQSDGLIEYVAVSGVEDLGRLTEALRRSLEAS